MKLETDELDQLGDYHLNITKELAQSIYNSGASFLNHKVEGDLNRIQDKLHIMSLSLARCRVILEQKKQQEKDEATGQ